MVFCLSNDLHRQTKNKSWHIFITHGCLVLQYNQIVQPARYNGYNQYEPQHNFLYDTLESIFLTDQLERQNILSKTDSCVAADIDFIYSYY
jgi:hypothetical protein